MDSKIYKTYFTIVETCIFIFLLIVLSGVISGICFFVIDIIYSDDDVVMSVAKSGLFVSVCGLITNLISCYFLIKIIKHRLSVSVADYIGFNPVNAFILIFWCLLIGAYIYIASLLIGYFNISIKSDFFSNLYKSTDYGWVVVVFIVIVAPFAEEVIFRGYMYSGCVNAIGVAGSIGLTSLVWALIHLQYSFIQMFYLFVFGLLLGLARYKTRSIIVPICMHVILNSLAVIAFLIE